MCTSVALKETNCPEGRVDPQQSNSIFTFLVIYLFSLIVRRELLKRMVVDFCGLQVVIKLVHLFYCMKGDKTEEWPRKCYVQHTIKSWMKRNSSNNFISLAQFK